jgi:prepilin-type processing-associated H-X9-DG protein
MAGQGQKDDRRTKLWIWVGVAIVVFLIFGVGILGAILFPVFARARETARKAVCLSNVKNIALAFDMYLEDNDDRFPAADAWCDALEAYLPNTEVYRCASVMDQPCGYAYNAALSHVQGIAPEHASATVLIFESDRGWNAAGGPELLSAEPRHLGGDNFGYADGHAEWMIRWRTPAPEQRWQVE